VRHRASVSFAHFQPTLISHVLGTLTPSEPTSASRFPIERLGFPLRVGKRLSRRPKAFIRPRVRPRERTVAATDVHGKHGWQDDQSCQSIIEFELNWRS
jgi:hypothetical protein